MTRVTIPPDHEPERRYAVTTVFRDFLGLEATVETGPVTETVINITEGCRLVVADGLFAIPENEWLTPACLPFSPLASWDTRSLPQPARGVGAFLPLLFGGPGDGERFNVSDDGTARLDLDIFGTAFFLLTRMEEEILDDQDDHGRFPAASAVGVSEGFLHRPLVNEYAEVLWACLHHLMPGIDKSKRDFRVLVSHDVDQVLHDGFGPTGSLISWTLATSWSSRRPDQTLAEALHWRRRRNNYYKDDPFNTFDSLMDTAERHGLRSAFYFLCGRTAGALDGDYDLESPFIRRLIGRIHERGHEIGLHPSYNTLQDGARVRDEFEALRHVCCEEGIRRDAWGGRQHYLRWAGTETWQAWADAGLAYDSTLGFPESPGFRTGSCYEYGVFNLRTREALDLRERPLVVMDTTLFAPHYMNLEIDAPETLDTMIRLKETCRSFDGDFTLLWHNSSFLHPKALDVFGAVLAA